ncbi:hypothetical protein [Enterobacter huaxiensis]|uniref:hypothetical protein n=1 Tax=Enterobacter huaxiensis TaxID=2494702 RepID=UPI000E746405|nr:hypothetical protein [Enterobacter huaxiensis]UNC49600.1 hypothetical protein D5067_0008450 [Enterobacter huaxiensis]
MSKTYQNHIIRDERVHVQRATNLKSTNELIINFIFGLCIFATSFRILIVAVVLLAISALWMLLTLKAPLKTFAIIGLVLLFLFSYYFLGLAHYERGPEKFTNAFSLILLSFIFFFILGYKERSEDKIKWLNYFSLCSISYVLIVCVYSMSKGYPGYNLVYDPINRSEENSPLYALQLVLFTIAYVNFNWSRKSRLFNIILTVVATIFSVFYLGSRAAFFLLVIFWALKFIFKKKNVLPMLLVVFIISPIIIILISNYDFTGSFNFGGFSERGLDSPRFSMFIYGVSHFLDYPVGGLKVHADGYTGIWFHNMLLDIVRVSGFYVMFLWMFILSITTYFLIKNKNKSYLILFIIINIAFMQDLAFDGFFNLMALEFYLIGASLFRGRDSYV